MPRRRLLWLDALWGRSGATRPPEVKKGDRGHVGETRLGRSDLQKLLRAEDGIKVSIYLPMDPTTAERRGAAIRLRNLLGTAETALEARDVEPAAARALLGPAREILDDRSIWKERARGLAFLMGRDFFRAYEPPGTFDEVVVVGPRFHLKPLIPLVHGAARFFVLGLSRNSVRLWEGDRKGLRPLRLEGLPSSLRETGSENEPRRELQFHTSTPAGGGAGRRPAVHHGHHGNARRSDDRVHRSLKQIDGALAPLISESGAPLVVAAVEELLARYRKVHSAPQLLAGEIRGNPEQFDDTVLHEGSWPLARAHLDRRRKEAAARYRRLRRKGSRLCSNRVENVVRAAHYGRVDSLLVAIGSQVWGRFERRTGRVIRLRRMEKAEGDLLDDAAGATLVHGGTEYAISRDEMPEDTTVAAILRY
jgi:hypothetical protein